MNKMLRVTRIDVAIEIDDEIDDLDEESLKHLLVELLDDDLDDQTVLDAVEDYEPAFLATIWSVDES